MVGATRSPNFDLVANAPSEERTPEWGFRGDAASADRRLEWVDDQITHEGPIVETQRDQFAEFDNLWIVGRGLRRA